MISTDWCAQRSALEEQLSQFRAVGDSLNRLESKFDKGFSGLEDRITKLGTKISDEIKQMDEKMDIQFDNISEEIKNMGTKFGSEVTECNKTIFHLHAVCSDFSSLSACEATNL